MAYQTISYCTSQKTSAFFFSTSTKSLTYLLMRSRTITDLQTIFSFKRGRSNFFFSLPTAWCTLGANALTQRVIGLIFMKNYKSLPFESTSIIGRLRNCTLNQASHKAAAVWWPWRPVTSSAPRSRSPKPDSLRRHRLAVAPILLQSFYSYCSVRCVLNRAGIRTSSDRQRIP